MMAEIVTGDGYHTGVASLFDLTGKSALVTGGSRGLGLEMALALGEAGAKVAITARRTQWLEPAERELRAKGIDCLSAICDVADAGQAESAVAAAMDRFGRIDILVNNAGVSWAAPAESMTPDKWQEVMATNATGCFVMSQAVGKEMIRAGGGSIINIASAAGMMGTAPEVLDAIGYSASKGAVLAFTQDLAVKWARHGIRVNAIAPGFFDTRMSTRVIEHAQDQIERLTPLGRIGAPGELGGVVVFFASDASSYITGQVLPVDGGMTSR
jgi:gluconate 5-dehydrogenase